MKDVEAKAGRFLIGGGGEGRGGEGEKVCRGGIIMRRWRKKQSEYGGRGLRAAHPCQLYDPHPHGIQIVSFATSDGDAERAACLARWWMARVLAPRAAARAF